MMEAAAHLESNTRIGRPAIETVVIPFTLGFTETVADSRSSDLRDDNQRLSATRVRDSPVTLEVCFRKRDRTQIRQQKRPRLYTAERESNNHDGDGGHHDDNERVKPEQFASSRDNRRRRVVFVRAGGDPAPSDMNYLAGSDTEHCKPQTRG